MPRLRQLAARARGLLRRLAKGRTGGPIHAPGWTASLQDVQVERGHLRLSGWAMDRDVEYTVAPEIRLWVQSARNPDARVEARVLIVPSPEPNLKSNGATTTRDYANCAFTAEVDMAALIASADRLGPGPWPVEVSVTGSGATARGTFTERLTEGPAGYLLPFGVGADVLLPEWEPGSGLSLALVGSPVKLASVVVDPDGTVAVGLTGNPRQVRLAGTPTVELQRTDGPDGVRWRGTVPAQGVDENTGWTWTAPKHTTAAPRSSWKLRAVRGGRLVDVLAVDWPEHAAVDGLLVEPGPDGAVRLVRTECAVLVDSVAVLTGEVVGLRVSGRVVGTAAGATLVLYGRRDRLSTPLTPAPDGTFEAVVPLRASSWGLPPVPPMMGTYALLVVTADGHILPATVPAQRPGWLLDGGLCEWFRWRFELAPGRCLALRLNRPLADDELGLANQARLEAEYASGDLPVLDAVYLESFYERMATCNPRALDRLLARDHPELTRYWGVRDRSVQVPPGAVPVVDGTRQWWAVRGGCRWVITNDWLRARFVHQPHQVVLQTWHGTMYKKIGLDLARTTGDLVPKFLHERSLWDLLLSQNPHSSAVFRTAYAWEKPLLEAGYPRNDLLRGGDGAAIRAQLGIRPDQSAVLYAPTWRDNQTELVNFLDVDEVAALLGDDYVLLLRAHSRTLRYGDRARVGGNVIDVTTYPDITDLFLAADQLVTDYSSVMFDYSVLGRPMIFFVPDLAEYRDDVRGVYFDLAELAPGPVVETQADVVAAIRNARTDVERYAARYAAWRERFNPWDDGHAGERVLAALFASRTQDGRTKG